LVDNPLWLFLVLYLLWILYRVVFLSDLSWDPTLSSLFLGTGPSGLGWGPLLDSIQDLCLDTQKPWIQFSGHLFLTNPHDLLGLKWH
jgi:hypothetical protein